MSGANPNPMEKSMVSVLVAENAGGYLRMRASRASWAAEVACCDCIKLCSGEAAHCLLFAGLRFVGVVGSASWLLVRRFLLPGGWRNAARTSWISCCTTDSCIVISSIVVEEAMSSGEGGAEMAVCSSSLHVRLSTAAWRTAFSFLESSCASCSAVFS
jgi:hypothetical protein